MKRGLRTLAFGITLFLTTVVSIAEEHGDSVSVNDMEMYYDVHGEGEPLVLLHGFNGSGVVWQSFIEDFSGEYKVIIPDLRGHGRSTNRSGEFTHSRSAQDVYGLLDSLKIDEFKAMGISTGGMTLLHMATQQPKRVEAMVLIGATIYFPEQAREIMRKSKIENFTEKDWERQRKVHKLGDDQIRMLTKQFYGFKDSYDDMNFTEPYLSTITARTFIVHGDRDQFFPVNIPVEMYGAIPDSSLLILPTGGHVPIYGKHRTYFTEMAQEFLRGARE